MYNVLYLYALKVHSFWKKRAREQRRDLKKNWLDERLNDTYSIVDLYIEKIFFSLNDVCRLIFIKSLYALKIFSF